MREPNLPALPAACPPRRRAARGVRASWYGLCVGLAAVLWTIAGGNLLLLWLNQGENAANLLRCLIGWLSARALYRGRDCPPRWWSGYYQAASGPERTDG